MKRFLLAMALSLSFSISAFCQVDFKDIRDRIVKDYRGARDEFAEVPNMSFLLGQSRILVRISYSEAVIKGADEEAIMESEPNWEDGKVAIGMRFLDALNSKIQDEGVIATSKSKGEEMYRLVVVPTYIGKSGDVKAYAVFYDPSGQQVLRLDGLKATGGFRGSFINLVGDGMESLGKDLGRKFKWGLQSAKDSSSDGRTSSRGNPFSI